jgi:hypothetical protein
MRWVIVNPEMSVGDSRCATLPHNVQKTKLTVHYRWHPWFERSVDAIRTIRRETEVSIRVEYSVGNRQRWIDVPAWMFDTTACAAMIATQSPAVSCFALVELKALLSHAVSSESGFEIEPEHSSSPRQGDAHAKVSPKASRVRTARPVSTNGRSSAVEKPTGQSASGSITRSGFERLVADVCMGEVGAVAARESSRFARNSREWQQLIEVCRVVDTVLVDHEQVYSPRVSNDRLLLGLKGSLNEYELDLLRQRSLEARYEKARRGELVITACVGFLKTPDQRMEKDPDKRVQQPHAAS